MKLDRAKIRGDIGKEVKIKIGGKYRRGRLLAVGTHHQTKETMVKVRINYSEMPWSAAFQQTDWHSVTLIRKADKVNWQ